MVFCPTLLTGGINSSDEPAPETVSHSEQSMRDVVEEAKTRVVISSGSPALDRLLGGGYETSRVVELYGESKTGKTQVALQAALSAATRKFQVLFVDTEGTFRPERIESMAEARGVDPGKVLPRIFRTRATEIDSQLGSLGSLASGDLPDCRMVVVDTLTKNFGLRYPGRRNAPKRQGLLDVYLGELRRDAFLNRRAVLVTNRVTVSGLGTASRETHVGGKTVAQMVDRAIHLRRRGERVFASLVVDDSDVRTEECSIDRRGFN